MVRALSDGDPHLHTFDNLAYDFQAVGEFTLFRSTDGKTNFQVRQQPLNGSTSVAFNTAVATVIDGIRVGVYAGRAVPLLIGDQAVVLKPGDTIAVGGGSVSYDGNNYVITDAQGSGVWARTSSSAQSVSLRAFVSDAQKAKVEGLLGNADGSTANDFRLPDGSVIAQPISEAALYRQFGEAWRITGATSLFSYQPGESTEGFTNRNFPSSLTTVADLAPAVRSAAEAIVLARGIARGTFQFDSAVLDVALSGDADFAAASADGPQPAAGATTVVTTRAPLAIADRGTGFTTTEAASFTTANVLANDSAGKIGDPITLASFSAAGTRGLVTSNGNGCFGYNPNGQFESLGTGATATDSFSYVIRDTNSGQTASGSVIITITGVNDAPVAANDSATTREGTQITLSNLLANDTDIDAGDTRRITGVTTTGTLGTVVLNANGSVTYDPGLQFDALTSGQTATDSFRYTIADAAGATSTATVNLTITGIAGVVRTGTAAGEALLGSAQGDVLRGLGGNDSLRGLGGGDVLDGGSGTDVADYTGSPSGVTVRLDTGAASGGDAAGDSYISIEGLVGSAFADVLIGDGGANSLNGGVGDDRLWGLGGNDTIAGGDGDDILNGGAGGDAFDGGIGLDRVSYAQLDPETTDNSGLIADLGAPANNSGAAAGDSYVNVEALEGTGGNDILRGNALPNQLFGLGGADTLVGLAGNDLLDGGLGNDIIDGGTGDDSIVGDAGADVILGGDGNDTIDAGADDDRITPGNGNDQVDGGSGFDTLVLAGRRSEYNVTSNAAGGFTIVDTVPAAGQAGNEGTDQIVNVEAIEFSDQTISLTGRIIPGTSGDDVLTGGSGNDTISGLAGNDTLIGGDGDDLLNGGTGNDVLNGGAGNDTASYADALGAVKASLLLAAIQSTGTEGKDTLVSIENLIGGRFADRLTGNALANRLEGGDGNDILIGDAGDDVLIGGAGADKLDGGTDADTLLGGAGNDSYVVDNINDLAVELADEGIDTVQASITYRLPNNVEKLVLTGTQDIDGFGNSLANSITGNSGRNTLVGGAGKDTLSGGSGDDIIAGGADSDVLVGGAGNDRFIFDDLPGPTIKDTIRDFVPGQDKIVLDRSTFTAISGTGTLTASQFGLGSAATTAAQRLIYNAATGLLSYDADGNLAGAAIAIAQLATKPALTASDIEVQVTPIPASSVQNSEASRLIQAIASFGVSGGSSIDYAVIASTDAREYHAAMISSQYTRLC